MIFPWKTPGSHLDRGYGAQLGWCRWQRGVAATGGVQPVSRKGSRGRGQVDQVDEVWLVQKKALT